MQDVNNRLQAIVMPKLGLSMTEGMVVQWHVATGARVAPGDVIADLETSKITSELEAHDAGVLRGELAATGVDLPVGALLCVLAAESATEQEVEDFIAGFVPLDGDAVAVTGGTDGEAGDPEREGRQRQTDDPAAATAAGEGADAPAVPVAGSTPGRAGPAPAPRPQPGGDPGAGPIPATPMARRLAAQAGLDLADVTPTGPRGRVTKTDVENALAAGAPAAAPPATATAPDATGRETAPDEAYQEIPLTSMRRAIARRLTGSKQAAPHFRLVVEADVGRLLDLRADLNRNRENGKVSVNDLLVKAVAATLVKVPAVNIQFDGEVVRRYAAAHVAVAVALDEGLLTPIIRNADSKGIMEISRELAALGARARAGSLTPEEYEGGTFTLSNLGMFGIKAFDAIINPPQAAILAVGAAAGRRVLTDDGEMTATMLTATLSCDHRVIDGATGARFMQALRELLEHPYQLLV